jgi:hypothetical protein
MPAARAVVPPQDRWYSPRAGSARSPIQGRSRKEPVMLTTIAIILLVLWLLGLIGHVGGGLIHLLLVVAIVVFLVRIIQGRRPVL